MSSKIVLTLWGNLQSYGTDSLAYDRGAGDYPSRSAVTGMLLCALGAAGPQEELLAKMAGAFSLQVRSFGERRLMEDYHTISSQYKSLAAEETDKELKSWYKGMCLRSADVTESVQGPGNKITRRQYWVNRVYFAVLDFQSEELAKSVLATLESPAGALVLGRKCCTPKYPVSSGAVCMSDEDVQKEIDVVLTNIQGIMAGDGKWPQPVVLKPSGRCSDKPITGGQRWVRNDIPVRFGTSKRYQSREVWVQDAA